MPILSQVHELQVLVNQLKAVDVILPELFQVGAIISKLFSSWKSYKKKLLHDSKDYSLEELQKHLRIEEESKLRDKNENSYDDNNKANVVNKPSNKSNKGKQNQGNFLGPKKEQEKFKKFKGTVLFVENLVIMLENADSRKSKNQESMSLMKMMILLLSLVKLMQFKARFLVGGMIHVLQFMFAMINLFSKPTKRLMMGKRF